MMKPGIIYFPKCFVGPGGLNSAMFWGAQKERKKGYIRVLWSYSSTAVLPLKGTSGICLLTLGTLFLAPEIILPAGQDQSLALRMSILCPEI